MKWKWTTVREWQKYNISLAPPSDLSVANLRVQVTLPPDAHVLGALQTPRRTVVLSSECGVLSWGAPGSASGAAIDAFAFLLVQPLSADARIRVSWDTDEGPAAPSSSRAPASLRPARWARPGAARPSCWRG
jgi:hypothetical protein